jgi:ribonuclease H2 subunit C
MDKVNDNIVHLLPCNIDYDGPAPIEGFFIIEKNAEKLSSNFRGRELIGKEVKLPTNVVGINVRSTNTTNKNSLQVDGTFDKFFVWQHDVEPDTSNIQNCFEWFEISQSVSLLFFILMNIQ